MAGITVNGVGSGLDINDIVTQLVAAEITPARQRLDREETTVLARISAFGLIKSALSDLDTAAGAVASAASFQTSSINSGNPDVLSASATGTSLKGSFSIDVQRLAENHRLVMSNGVSSANATVGTGTLTLSVGSDAFDVAIDGSNNTLGGVRDAINDAAANSGLTATIINVDDGLGGTVSKLVLTADETGESSRIAVSVADDDGDNTNASGLSLLDQSQLTDRSPANLDALVEVDGEAVSSASNIFDGVIEGLTLSLVSADPGNPVTIGSSVDRGVAAERAQALVDAFNGARSVLGEATVADPDGGRSGALVGDSTARLLENRLRSALTDPVNDVNSVYTSLASIGIVTARDGSLEFDQAAFDSALTSDFDGVVALFASDNGVAARLGSRLDSYLAFDGLVDARTDGLTTQLEGIDSRRQFLATRESALETRLFAQFAAMDSLVATLQADGDFLLQQLDALNSSGQ